MRLRNAELAEIPQDKVVLYLLNLEHRDGRGKAVFFHEFGFRVEFWEMLAEAIRAHALAHEVESTEENEFGTKYSVVGELETPNGGRPNMRVVWFVEKGASAPRLVTAYPLARAR